MRILQLRILKHPPNFNVIFHPYHIHHEHRGVAKDYGKEATYPSSQDGHT